jgi:hypothetical protein
MLAAVCLLAAACQGPPQEALAPAAESVATRPAVARPGYDRPDTTGSAVLAWLEKEEYRETWELWPGTAPLHEARPTGVVVAPAGAEPHGALLITYANPVAIDALSRAAPAMPPGAVVLLEGYLPDSTLSSVSVMVQVGEFDPERQDWFFARFGSAGEIDAAGHVEACQGCHVSEPDYLFSGELGVPLPVDSTGATPLVAVSP